MRHWDFSRYALSSCGAITLLAGCGGSQPPIGPPVVLPHVARTDGRAAAVPAYNSSQPLLFVASSDSEGPIRIYAANENNPKAMANIKKGLFEPAGVCVDGAGTLYAVESGSDTIREYALGKTRPFQIITHGLLTPAFCAIDSAGNLWVTNMGDRDLIEYNRGQTHPHKIAKDGLTNPDGIAIDHQGNIYVGNLVPPSSSNVEVYSPNSKRPIRTITDGVSSPVGLAVDAKNTLYVTNDLPQGNVEEYRSGESAPYRTITDMLNFPGDVTVDKKGWIYVSNAASDDRAILEYPPNSLKPSREITKGIFNPLGVAHYPPVLP